MISVVRPDQHMSQKHYKYAIKLQYWIVILFESERSTGEEVNTVHVLKNVNIVATIFTGFIITTSVLQTVQK